jgi:glutamyl-tRNA reductase
VQLAEKIFGDLERRSALVIGAGEIAEGVAIMLHDQPLGSLTITNRTFSKAEEMASRYGGHAVPIEELSESLRRPDIIVTAVSSGEPIIRRDDAAPAFVTRRGARLVLDLGVPRNVDAEVGKLQQVFLYAVDDLQELVNLNLGRRKREIEAVEEIVAGEADRFFGWMTALSTKPVVKELREEADRLRREAIEKLGRMSPEQQAIVERFSVQYMNKMLHSPSVSLKDCDPATYRGLARIAWTRRLFGLGDSSANGIDPGAEE